MLHFYRHEDVHFSVLSKYEQNNLALNKRKWQPKSQKDGYRVPDAFGCLCVSV